jgi:3-oxoacyl-[acyl-carrier protein] reductase
MSGILEGKVAIVTGAGRGLGRAEALALAAAGAQVVVNDLGCDVAGEGAAAEVASGVVEEIHANGGTAMAEGSDVSTMAGARALIAAALDSFGRLDILVNNAGNARPATIERMTEEDWDQVIRVHLKGHFAAIHHAAAVFCRQRSGAIINTASTSGLGHYGMANYSAAKEGIVGLTHTVARDLGHYNVRCNAIRPVGNTRMGIPAILETIRISQDVLEIPASGSLWVGRDGVLPLPQRVGVFVAWLCSDAAANVNGRIFFVCHDTVGLYREAELERSMCRAGGWDIDSLNEHSARNYLVGDLKNPFLGKPLDRRG